MKVFFCIAVAAFILNNTICMAGWEALHYGMNQAVQTIYIDSINNRIYASGQFSQSDSIRTNCIAVWDGTKWDSVGTGAHFGIQNNAITKFQGQIYADGFYSPTSLNRGGRFNGISWDTLGHGTSGMILQLKEINGELWVGGMFTNAGNNNCNMLAKFDGVNWSCLNFPYDLGGRVEDFIYYGNEMIIGGGFFDSLGHIGICYYDGSQFDILGHRLFGNIAGVRTMAIYNGELYIGGYFLSSAGNEGNHIMKWDGTAWYDVGGGMDNEVYVLKVHNNELYAGGVFNYAGGVHTGNLAKWNGANWQGVTSSIISPVISAIEFYNDEIYIGGAFRYIDSVPVNYIAKHALNTNVYELKNDLQLKIHPVPSSDKLNVEMTNAIIQRIYIKDVSGKLIKSNSGYSSKFEIDITAFASGIYFIEAITEQGTLRKKFIKN